MSIVRLFLHSRKYAHRPGGTGIDGLHEVIVTMFVESCAFYAVTLLLVLGPWSAQNSAIETFSPIFAETQFISPFTNKSAFTSKSLVSGRISTFKAKSRGELTEASGTIPSGDPVSSVDEREMNTSEVRVGVETTNDSHQDMVY